MQLHDGMLVVLESVGELQRELAALKPVAVRVEALEDRLAASEAAGEALRAELGRAADSLTVLSALVTRLCREDAAGQAALARLGDEAARLRGVLGGGERARGHGSVRTMGGPRGGGGGSSGFSSPG